MEENSDNSDINGFVNKNNEKKNERMVFSK